MPRVVYNIPENAREDIYESSLFTKNFTFEATPPLAETILDNSKIVSCFPKFYSYCTSKIIAKFSFKLNINTSIENISKHFNTFTFSFN